MAVTGAAAACHLRAALVFPSPRSPRRCACHLLQRRWDHLCIHLLPPRSRPRRYHAYRPDRLHWLPDAAVTRKPCLTMTITNNARGSDRKPVAAASHLPRTWTFNACLPTCCYATRTPGQYVWSYRYASLRHYGWLFYRLHTAYFLRLTLHCYATCTVQFCLPSFPGRYRHTAAYLPSPSAVFLSVPTTYYPRYHLPL